MQRPVEHRLRYGISALCARRDVVEDVFEQPREKRRAIFAQVVLEPIKERWVGAVRIVFALRETGHHRRDKPSFDHSPATMAREVAHDLATSHRETDEGHVLHTCRLDDSRQIVGKHVVVVPRTRLGRTAESTPVITDDAITCIGERYGLMVPAVGRKWPSMREYHWAARSPILDKEFGRVLQLDAPASVARGRIGLCCCI